MTTKRYRPTSSFTLPSDLLESLNNASEKSGKPSSQIVEAALKQHLVCKKKEADAWMWTMLIERQGRRSTNTWPSLWDDEKGAKAEAELHFECKVIKVKGKEPMFL